VWGYVTTDEATELLAHDQKLEKRLGFHAKLLVQFKKTWWEVVVSQVFVVKIEVNDSQTSVSVLYRRELT
jgi:hypothetical protein